MNADGANSGNVGGTVADRRAGGPGKTTARGTQVRAWPQRAGTSAVGADMLTRHQIADAFGTQLVATGSSGRRGWADRMPPAARMIGRMWTCA
jgi:hypothetical protein